MNDKSIPVPVSMKKSTVKRIEDYQKKQLKNNNKMSRSAVVEKAVLDFLDKN